MNSSLRLSFLARPELCRRRFRSRLAARALLTCALLGAALLARAPAALQAEALAAELAASPQPPAASSAPGTTPGSRPAPEIALLTMGPGEDLYARFGHAALLVSSPAGDVVYNYGYTDFTDPWLILAFLRGRAPFWVATMPLDQTLELYAFEDRSVYLQPLQLTAGKRQLLAQLLTQNALPENRYYIYHHFQDNCATRLRDLLDQVSGGALQRQLRGRPSGQTLRHYARRGFAGRPEVQLASELLLGRSLDRPVDRWQATFLPWELRQAVRSVTLAKGRLLAAPPAAIYEREQPSPLARGELTSLQLLWAALTGCWLLALLLVLLARARRRLAGLVLALPALLLGLIGLLLWSLALFSTLPELRQNELLLSLWPLDLLLLGPALRWLRGRLVVGKLLRAYATLRLSGMGLVLAGQASGLLIQQPLVVPLLATIFAVGLAGAVFLLPRAREALPGRPWQMPAGSSAPHHLN